MNRPGPEILPENLAPGGLVIQVYAVPTERKLLDRILFSYEEIEDQAAFDADACENDLRPGETAFCIVVFDGDTGHRYGDEEWRAALDLL